ncbi:low molecular weight phosphatase family protein [Plantibacter flavus]|uniref:arsenate reductase/protein-tyrosine-phosphatase family protein n=1 Tax=Plantibacter flavus TaxID=150123 RepID=UPI003F178EDD
MRPHTTSTGPIRILIVCTGNICRSPYAEFVLASRLREIDADAFIVRSAGTRAMRGHAIDGSSAALLGPIAAESGAFTASQLHIDDIGASDVILTMTREQRSQVLQLRPDALRRTFTLREFARLLDTIDVGALPLEDRARWLSALPLLAANRTGARLNQPADDDVIDPYRLGPDAFRQMAQEIDPALERITAFALRSVHATTTTTMPGGHHVR